MRWAWTASDTGSQDVTEDTIWISVWKYRMLEKVLNLKCVIFIQGPDVLPEPSEGSWRAELKAAASSQRAEWGIPHEAGVLYTGHICE